MVGRGKTPHLDPLREGAERQTLKAAPSRRDPFDTLEKEPVGKKVFGEEGRWLHDGYAADGSGAHPSSGPGRCRVSRTPDRSYAKLIKTLHLEDLLTALPRPPKAAVAGASEKIPADRMHNGPGQDVRGASSSVASRRSMGRFPAFTTSFWTTFFPALHQINGFAAVSRGATTRPVSRLPSWRTQSAHRALMDRRPAVIIRLTCFADRTNSGAAVIEAELDCGMAAGKTAGPGRGGRSGRREKLSPDGSCHPDPQAEHGRSPPARDKPAGFGNRPAHPTLPARQGAPSSGRPATGKPKAPARRGRKASELSTGRDHLSPSRPNSPRRPSRRPPHPCAAGNKPG